MAIYTLSPMARVFQECMVLVLLPDENRRCQQSSGQIPWFKHQPFLFTTQRKKIEATKTYGCPGTIAVPLFLAYQAPLDPIFSPNWHVTWYDENHWLFWQVAPGNFFLANKANCLQSGGWSSTACSSCGTPHVPEEPFRYQLHLAGVDGSTCQGNVWIG